MLKKQNIPLAASSARRTPPSVPSAGVNVEEGFASFRGFVPEVSPTPEADAVPSFVLRDESGSEASYRGEQGAETSFEEPPLGASTVTTSEPERFGEGNEAILETRDMQVTRRVKHPARKRKFTAQDRIVEMISVAERMWGKAVIRPSNVEEVRQESAPLGDESLEERDEDAGTPRDESPNEEFAAEGTPRTPFSERPETPPLPKDDCEMGHATPKYHALHLNNLKLTLEHLRWKIPKNQDFLGKWSFGTCRAPLLKYRVHINPKQLLISECLNGLGLTPRIPLLK